MQGGGKIDTTRPNSDTQDFAISCRKPKSNRTVISVKKWTYSRKIRGTENPLSEKRGKWKRPDSARMSGNPRG